MMGDGFTNHDMGAGGAYDQAIEQTLNSLFGYEPFTTYSGYFNIYTVQVVSPENGVTQPGDSRITSLNVSFNNTTSTTMGMDERKVIQYASKVPGYSSIRKKVICIVANTKRHGGTCYWWSDPESPSIAIGSLSKNAATTLVHELGGHGIGRLGDEYTGTGNPSASTTIPSDIASNLIYSQGLGMFLNLSTIANPTLVPWSSFIDHPKYPMVGLYEGGYYYVYGVWRSEENSIMKQSASGASFNAISRFLIAKQILTASGISLTFEEFIQKDVAPPITRTPLFFTPLEEAPHTPPHLDGQPIYF